MDPSGRERTSSQAMSSLSAKGEEILRRREGNRANESTLRVSSSAGSISSSQIFTCLGSPLKWKRVRSLKAFPSDSRESIICWVTNRTLALVMSLDPRAFVCVVRGVDGEILPRQTHLPSKRSDLFEVGNADQDSCIIMAWGSGKLPDKVHDGFGFPNARIKGGEVS